MSLVALLLLSCAEPRLASTERAPVASARLATLPPFTVDPGAAPRVVVDSWYQGSAATTTAIGPDTAVGDVNGDGYPDVLLGAGSRIYVYPGSALGASVVPSHTIVLSGVGTLGSTIAFLGDVNGDGYGDFASGATSGAGAVHVFHGSATGPSTSASDWSLSGSESGEALGSVVAAAGDVNGDGFADLLVGAERYDGSRTDQGRALLVLGSAAGLEGAAAWTVTGGQSSAWLGSAVAGVGDVDGDGYDDVMVGAWGYDDAVTDGGAAWLYRGDATGLSTTPAWTLVGDQARAYAGMTVAGVGDVDGDGLDDVIVGSSGYDDGHSNEGRIQLFTGTVDGLSTEALDEVQGGASNAEYGEVVLAGADFDGDGTGDVVVKSSLYLYVYHLYSGGFAAYSLSFVGASPGGAGDVDADGYDDLFWGYNLYSTISVYGYPGGPDGLDDEPSRASWILDNYTTQLGLSVADGGDLNGDGYGDLIVGDVYTPVRALGTPDGYAWEDISSIGSGSGAAGAGAVGDVDGDGYQDAVVGTTTSGRLYYGSASGPRDYLGIATSGTAVAAGDFDADGYPDFAVGQSGSYRTDVWYGSAAGVTSAYDLRLSGTSSSRYGAALASGDFDGDGYDDLAIGATQATTTLSGEGRVTVHRGSTTGLSAAADLTLPGGGASAGCGRLGAGDLDGDGYEDLVVGCPGWSAGTGGEGQVRLHRGSAGGLEESASWTFEGAVEDDGAGSALAVADFTGDGFADLAIHVPGDDTFFDADTGYVALFLGGPDGPGAEVDLVLVGHYTGWGVNNSLAAVSPPDGDGTMDLAWGVPLDSSYGGSGVWVYDLDDDDGDGASRYFDCDEGDPAVGPLGVEEENGRDDDCNGIVDDLPSWLYRDADGDGYGDDSSAVDSDEEVEGWVRLGGDCDDGNAEVNPAASETCDGDDDDCDGEIDEDGAVDGTAMYVDGDGDGYGQGEATLRCTVSEGWAESAGDCDDGEPEVSPGAEERCNDRDDDCDDEVDEDEAVDAPTWYVDGDLDGYGDPASALASCEAPDGTVEVGGDCDDGNLAVNPGAVEVCDAADTDEDCSGAAEEEGAEGELTWYADLDGDGFGDPGVAVLGCDQPDAAVADATDCDDEDGTVHPEAAELCDPFDRDEDCDGVADDADTDAEGTITWYADLDGDGYGDPGAQIQACDEVGGYVGDATDCDDAALGVNPGAEDTPDDGIDQDCDGEDASATGGDGGAGDGGAGDGGAGDGGAGDGGTDVLDGEEGKGCSSAPGGAALGLALLSLVVGQGRRRRA
ncbi:FG-GAP-like repeat-containing protein [Myxococcota bacterium]|nr:FG-GAP-like repeat-containing protein [Myxococcota bacterium]